MSLLLISLTSAINFYLLVHRKINLKEAFKLICVAAALNKLLFTGSGYLASSYFSRNKNLPFYKALSAFFLLEFLAVSLWLTLGVYFGAKIAIRMPLILVVVLIIFGIMVWLKKDKFIPSIKNILKYFKEMGARVFMVIPFVIINVVLFIIYYFFLFRLFNFHTEMLNIIKIVSVSFTIGYLSFAPTGLGFKDTGLVLLLMENGLSLNVALSIAIIDRVIITVFWGILGAVVGYDLIREEIKKRFKKRNIES